jgi:hemerythrin-like domain-containing protein
MGDAARDVALPRESLVSLAAEYLLANRLHMQTEEKHFLPRAMAFLTDDDWADVDASAAHIEDPLFGKQIADAYLFLYERILALHD